MTSPIPIEPADLRAAVALHVSGRLDDAEHAYRLLLKLQPGYPDANHNLGLLLSQTGRLADGLACLESAWAAKPDNETFLLSYSSALLDCAQPGPAAEVLDAAMARGMDSAAIRCNRGNAANALGSRGQAKQHFLAALAMKPGYAIAHYNIASLYQDQGLLAEAAREYRAALVSDAGLTEARNNLGIVLHQLGQLDDAVVAFVALLQASPDYAPAYHNLANALADQGQNEQALQCYGRAAQLNPAFGETYGRAAALLTRLRRHGEAAQWQQRLAEIEPQNAQARNDLGTILTQCGSVADAIVQFRAALAIKPNFAEASSNLGNALSLQGDYDEAENACRHALAIKPDLYQAYLNLGNALQGKFQYRDAEANYLSALRIERDSPEIHYNLGNALLAQERLAEAQACYEHALALRPDFAEACNNLGNALRSEGNFEAAISSYRRAIALCPDYAEAHNNLGIAVQHLDPSEAEAHCRKALELNPALPEALVFLADMMSDRGRFAEAEQLFKRAIDVAPGTPAAWAGLANSRKMTHDDHAWLAQTRKLAEQSLPIRQKTYLHFAIGKYFDDIKDYDQAFQHYRQANEFSRRFIPPYDALAETVLTDVLCHDFTREVILQKHRGASDSPRPVFVVGMPRSGTSLTEQILAAHPDAFGAGELPFWSQGMGLARRPGDEPAFSDLVEHSSRRYVQLLERLAPNAARVIDKMPGNFRNLGMIACALPGARIIHVQRHPIDTCLSIYFQHFNEAHPYAYDLDNLVHYHGLYRRIMAHWRAVLPPQRMLEIRYEDLVADTENTARAMLEFIGLPWDAQCLDFRHSERAVNTASRWQARQPIHSGSVERWRHYALHIAPLLKLAEPAPQTTEVPHAQRPA